MRKIIFLGTGHALPTKSCSTSILIEDNKTKLLIDTGAGQESVLQLFKTGHDPKELTNIFITHSHSDHIVGLFCLVRHFSKKLIKRKIFCSKEVKEAIDSLFKIVSVKNFETILPYTEFIIIEHNSIIKINDWELTFFDIYSNKCPQMAVSIKFNDDKKLTFLGDEPFNLKNEAQALNSDILIHEAFCLEKDREKYNPQKISHNTAKEAAINAKKLNARKLIIFHIEDDSLETRKVEYSEELKKYFDGEVFIPIDLDKIDF